MTVDADLVALVVLGAILVALAASELLPRWRARASARRGCVPRWHPERLSSIAVPRSSLDSLARATWPAGEWREVMKCPTPERECLPLPPSQGRARRCKCGSYHPDRRRPRSRRGLRGRRG